MMMTDQLQVYDNKAFDLCESTDLTLNVPTTETAQCSVLLQWKDLKVAVPSKKGPRIVLDGVSGHIQNQQITAILGPSGAGKSTLLNCISGECPPN